MNWPKDGELKSWLDNHPKVLLPSELRKRAGAGVEGRMT